MQNIFGNFIFLDLISTAFSVDEFSSKFLLSLFPSALLKEIHSFFFFWPELVSHKIITFLKENLPHIFAYYKYNEKLSWQKKAFTYFPTLLTRTVSS